jgi:hypothetical protein
MPMTMRGCACNTRTTSVVPDRGQPKTKQYFRSATRANLAGSESCESGWVLSRCRPPCVGRALVVFLTKELLRAVELERFFDFRPGNTVMDVGPSAGCAGPEERAIPGETARRRTASRPCAMSHSRASSPGACSSSSTEVTEQQANDATSAGPGASSGRPLMATVNTTVSAHTRTDQRHRVAVGATS